MEVGLANGQVGASIYKPLTGATEVARGRAISGNATRALAAKYGKESLLSEDMLNTIDQVGGFVRLPSRLMMGTDEFAKHIAIREVASRGVKKAYEQLGVDGLKDKARSRHLLRTSTQQRSGRCTERQRQVGC